MRQHRRCKLLLCLLLPVLLLCGCAQDLTLTADVETLLTAPAQTAVQTGLLQAAYTYLGSSIALKYPMDAYASAPFYAWDADGDGRQELLVFYQNTAKSKNVQLAVLRPAGDGGWYAAHMDVEGAAGETDGARILHLADGCDCLLIGYQEPTGQDWTVCLYQWQDGALHERTRLVCQQYAVTELDGDGCQQLAVVQRATSYGPLQLRLLTAAQADSGTFLQEQTAVMLDPRFAHCAFLAQVSDSSPGLVMDFTDDSGGRLGEAMVYAQGSLIRCYAEDNLNLPNFTSRPFDGLDPMDVDGDGALEMPRVENRVLGATASDRFFFVSWHAPEVEGTSLRGYGILDRNASYLLLLPSAWYSQVILQEEGQGGWTVRAIGSGEQLLSWQVTQGRSPGNDYQLLGRLGEQAVYLRFGAALTPEEQTAVLDGFFPLYG